DALPSLVAQVEGLEGIVVGTAPRGEEFVEERLPRVGVRAGRVGDDSVHVEEDGVEGHAQAAGAVALLACHRRRTSFSISTSTKTAMPTPTHLSHADESIGAVPKRAFMKGACVNALWRRRHATMETITARLPKMPESVKAGARDDRAEKR